MADLLRDALDHAEKLVRAAPPGRLGAPTSSDWDVAGLLNHMVGGNRYFAASARGEQPDCALFPADNVGGDAAVAYRRPPPRPSRPGPGRARCWGSGGVLC